MVVIRSLILIKQGCHKSSLTDPDDGGAQTTQNRSQNKQKHSKGVKNDRDLKRIVDGIANRPNNKLLLVGNLNKRRKDVTEHKSAIIGNKQDWSQMFIAIMMLINVRNDGAKR